MSHNLEVLRNGTLSEAGDSPDTALPPPEFPPIDPPEDYGDLPPRPKRINIAVNEGMWQALLKAMKDAGVDVDAVFAGADPAEYSAWQLDAAFHKMGLNGDQIYEAARVDRDTVLIRRSDGSMNEVIVL